MPSASCILDDSHKGIALLRLGDPIGLLLASKLNSSKNSFIGSVHPWITELLQVLNKTNHVS